MLEIIPLLALCGFYLLRVLQLSMVLLTQRNEDDNHESKTKRIQTDMEMVMVIKDKVYMVLIFMVVMHTV